MAVHHGGKGPGHLGRTQVLAFTPASLFSGTDGVWYDPSDLTNQYSDAGTTLAAVDGPVWQSNDKSGNARTLSVFGPTSTKRPILRSAASKYWWEFDGVDDMMAFNSPANTSTSTLWLAGKLRSAPAAAYKAGFSMGNQIIYANMSGNVWGSYNSAEVASSTIATSNIVMIVRTRAANDVDLFTNGTKQTLTNGTAFTPRSGEIGGSSGVQFADLNVYGVGGINRVLTDAEVANLNTWLAAKF